VELPRREGPAISRAIYSRGARVIDVGASRHAAASGGVLVTKLKICGIKHKRGTESVGKGGLRTMFPERKVHPTFSCEGDNSRKWRIHALDTNIVVSDLGPLPFFLALCRDCLLMVS
jgi:hypothetical protein